MAHTVRNASGTARGGSGTAKGGSGTAAAARLAAARDRALEQIGRRAVGYAKARCPVKTGALRASIAYRVKDGTLRVGSPLPYAAKAEREKPFLRPAMQEHRAEYRRIIRNALRG